MAAVEIAEHTTRWRLCKVEGDGRAEQRKRLVLSEINDDEVEIQEYVQMRMHGRASRLIVSLKDTRREHEPLLGKVSFLH